MSERQELEREVTEIVLAASAGDATDAQLARLSELILADESLALLTVQLWNQEAWLTWHGSQSHTDELLAQLALLKCLIQSSRRMRTGTPAVKSSTFGRRRRA